MVFSSTIPRGSAAGVELQTARIATRRRRPPRAKRRYGSTWPDDGTTRTPDVAGTGVARPAPGKSLSRNSLRRPEAARGAARQGATPQALAAEVSLRRRDAPCRRHRRRPKPGWSFGIGSKQEGRRGALASSALIPLPATNVETAKNTRRELRKLSGFDPRTEALCSQKPSRITDGLPFSYRSGRSASPVFRDSRSPGLAETPGIRGARGPGARRGFLRAEVRYSIIAGSHVSQVSRDERAP